MGLNTTVVVMNDALHDIADDKNFGKSLAEAVMRISVRSGELVDVPALSHCNAATVIESHHADYRHVVLVGGNRGRDLGYVGGYRLDPADDDGARELLRRLAHNLGLDISIRRQRKAVR